MSINLMRLLWPQSFYLENVLQQSKCKIFYSNVLMVLLSNCIKIFKCVAYEVDLDGGKGKIR